MSQRFTQHGTSSTGETGLKYRGLDRDMFELDAFKISATLIVKGCVGSSDECGGCDPCISQSQLTKSGMADLYDKPGQNPNQKSCLDINRELACWQSTISYMPG